MVKTYTLEIIKNTPSEIYLAVMQQMVVLAYLYACYLQGKRVIYP